MSMFRMITVAAMLTVTAAPAAAQSMLSPGALLGQASDAALDKLARPGAFAADDAIRIGLPGPLNNSPMGQLGGLLKSANQAGLGGNLTNGLNDAAGAAARAAKPIFRSAISKMSPADMAGIIAGGSTAGTDYLQRSAGPEINAKLAPVVRAALSRAGVLKQTSQLSAVGMTPDRINDYVTQKAAEGIFTYMGREETTLRANPLGAARSILGTITR